MELGNQMKKYRNELGLSQDALAEKIYVSRQTISNWETGKNYPDINSLIRMSEVFHVTVDVLLKGDLKEMKEMIKEEDKREFNQFSWIYTVLFGLTVLTPVPLIKFLKLWGVALWALLFLVTFAVAMLIEKKKKQWNIQTMREIVSFVEGKQLDELEAAREEGKRPYQKILAGLAGAVIALVVGAIMLFLLR